MKLFSKHKKILSYLVIIPVIISLTFSSLAVRTVYALDTVPPVPVSDDALRSKFVGVTVMGYTVPGFSWNAVYILAMKTLLAQITDSIVDWINNGFEDGGPSFVTDPEQFLLGVGDEVVGEFINEMTAFGWLCDPYRLNMQIVFSLGIGTFQRQRKCTLTAIIKNFDNFVNGTFKEGGWKGWFYITTNPNADPGTAFLSAHAELQKRMLENKDREIKKLDWGRGFFSWRECEAYDVSSSDTSEDAKKDEQVFDNKNEAHKCSKWSSIKTPGTVIESQLEHTLGTSLRQMELADDIDKIVGALVSKLVTTVLQKGLTSLNSNDGWEGTTKDLDKLNSKGKMSGTCSADTSTALTGETVEWSVYTTGGSSDKDPEYKWSGAEIANNTVTEENSIQVVYNGIGKKKASVKVTKGNKTVNIKCGGNVKVTAGDDTDVGDSSNEGYCSANKSAVKVGNSVIWKWTPYVANSYAGASYEWKDENENTIEGASNNKSFTIYYNDTGEKSASVTVTKGGESSNYDCGIVDVSGGGISSSSSSSETADFCSVDKTKVLVNETVGWSVSHAKNDGTVTYNWISDGVDGPFGTTKTVYTSYTTATIDDETRKASVEVTKNGETSTLTCLNSVSVSNPNLSATCSVNLTNGQVGTEFTWTAVPFGGTGEYSYSWSGTEGLAGNEESITTTYSQGSSAGLLKTAQVTVTSDDKIVTANCSNTARVYSQ